MSAAAGMSGSVCFVAVGLASSVGLQKGLEDRGVIVYLVLSYLLDGFKSFGRDWLEE